MFNSKLLEVAFVGVGAAGAVCSALAMVNVASAQVLRYSDASLEVNVTLTLYVPASVGADLS